MKDADFIYVPFTEAQVISLNEYQPSGAFHPFTCGNELCPGKHQHYCEHGKHINTEGCVQCEPEYDSYTITAALETGNVLVASIEGWKCPSCDYTQEWAWKWMGDDSWQQNVLIANA